MIFLKNKPLRYFFAKIEKWLSNFIPIYKKIMYLIIGGCKLQNHGIPTFIKDSAPICMLADNDSVIQAKLWPNDLTFISLLPHYESLLSYENDIQHFCHCMATLSSRS